MSVFPSRFQSSNSCMSSRASYVLRICVAAAALLCALFAPWWIPALLMIGLSMRFDAWEVPLIGLLIDFVWLPGDHLTTPLFTLLGIAAVWLALPLRRQLLV